MFKLRESKGKDRADEDDDDEEEEEEEGDNREREEDRVEEANQSINHCNPRVEIGWVAAIVLWNANTE